MKLSRRYIVFIALILVLSNLIWITACSGNGTSVTTTSSVNETTAGTSEETTNNETTKEDLSGELVVATWAGDPFQSAWRDMFDEFEAQTNVKVVMDAIPWENLREKSALELASGTGAYDVLYVHPSWFEEFADNGFLLPVEEVLSQDIIDKYVPDLLNSYRKDDVLYGLPDFITTQTLAYRKDIFEENDIDAPQSWDEVLAAADKLSDGDNLYGITFPGKKSGALASIFGALLVGNNGWFYDNEGNPNANSSEAVEVAEYLGKLSQYAPSGFMNFHWDENSNVAASGKAAMIMCMTVNSAWLEDPNQSSTVGKWGYVPIYSNSGTPGGIVDSYCWSIANGTTNEPEAAALISFITDTEAQTYFTEKSGTCGATKAYYENTALLESTPVLQAMNETFNNIKPNPSWKSWSAQQEVLETQLQDVMTGKTNAQAAMDALQAFMEAE